VARGDSVGEGIPSRGCAEANAQALARYATLRQEAGLVPVVEPEVLIDGEHSLERSFDVTEEALRTVFNHLYAQRVVLVDMILNHNKHSQTHDFCGIPTVRRRRIIPGADQPDRTRDRSPRWITV
jgi:fructose-bisphosphate aldolase class 1